MAPHDTPTAITTCATAIEALRHRVNIHHVPAGTEFDVCNHTGACDGAPAVVTLYGTDTTLDACLLCAPIVLADSFHVDTGNNPDRTKAEISVVATGDALPADVFGARARLAWIVDNDGREGDVQIRPDLFRDTTPQRVDVHVNGTFDPTTAHGRDALTALRDALTTVLRGAA